MFISIDKITLWPYQSLSYCNLGSVTNLANIGIISRMVFISIIILQMKRILLSFSFYYICMNNFYLKRLKTWLLVLWTYPDKALGSYPGLYLYPLCNKWIEILLYFDPYYSYLPIHIIWMVQMYNLYLKRLKTWLQRLWIHPDNHLDHQG